MIEVSHLSKSYGAFEAVRDVSFHVDKGEVVGFLGPNGAGKSTTLRILAGFLGPTRGHVRIAGHDIADDPIAARASLGYMPETAPLYPEMRVREYLAFRAELKGIARPKRRDAVAQALGDARVDDVADAMIGHLSKGYRQRVGLADALVGSPPLLILDEPTAGLDPNQIREVRALIRRLGDNHTVLLSTHILPEVEATCTRALVIARGRLVAQGSIDEIRALRRPRTMRVGIKGAGGRARAVAARVAGVRRVELAAPPLPPGHDARLVVTFAPDADPGSATEAVVAALVGESFGVREVTAETASLEQIFSELTGQAVPADDEGVTGERDDDDDEPRRTPEAERAAGGDAEPGAGEGDA